MEDAIKIKQSFTTRTFTHHFKNKLFENSPKALNQLEKEGVIQRFECCVEFALKPLKAPIENCGTVFATMTPRAVVKDAFLAKVIEVGKVWINRLDHRNLLSPPYEGKALVQQAGHRTAPVAPFKEMGYRYPKRMPIVSPRREPCPSDLNGTVRPDAYL